MSKRILHLTLFCTIFILFSNCNKKIISPTNTTTLNSKKAQEKPYVILISLDGYRWDYTERFKPPNISKFIKEGVQAESLIPCFPSKTFPNHYSIATGMYPNNHSLVSNSFFNADKNLTYKTSNRALVEDGSWYGGIPIWVLAAKADMVTASFFFVGSEAEVQGFRPSYYYLYNGSIKNEVRVEQAIEWLKMPADKRPHLIAMYFSDMDDLGHLVGPNNDEILTETIFSLDKHLGNLFEGVKKTGLPVNIIIVSDHGMLEISTEQYIPIESIENDNLYKTVSNGAIVHIYPNDISDTDKIFDILKSKENNFNVYKTKDTPFFEILPTSKNWGAIQVIPQSGWYFTEQRNIGLKKTKNIKINGEHGFDVNIKDLHAIFYANGPAFKNGYTRPSVKNIHVYPVICKILGLDIPQEVDGKLSELEDVLK